MQKEYSREIERLFDASINTLIDSKTLTREISVIVNAISQCLHNGNKIILFGNGGSAADAQHIAAELIGRYLIERKSLPAISLTTDSSILTAIGNDYSFNDVFSRQCESLVKKGDIIIAISTSGNSPNVIKGVKTGKRQGAIIISLTGKTGGKLKQLSDYIIRIPSCETPRIQEGHRVIIHIICELVELRFKR